MLAHIEHREAEPWGLDADAGEDGRALVDGEVLYGPLAPRQCGSHKPGCPSGSESPILAAESSNCSLAAARKAAPRRSCAHTASRSSRMVDLVRAGLATAQEHRVVAGPNKYEVAYLRITQADRQVLAGPEAQ